MRDTVENHGSCLFFKAESRAVVLLLLKPLMDEVKSMIIDLTNVFCHNEASFNISHNPVHLMEESILRWTGVVFVASSQQAADLLAC